MVFFYTFTQQNTRHFQAMAYINNISLMNTSKCHSKWIKSCLSETKHHHTCFTKCEVITCVCVCVCVDSMNGLGFWHKSEWIPPSVLCTHKYVSAAWNYGQEMSEKLGMYCHAMCKCMQSASSTLRMLQRNLVLHKSSKSPII
jgi:hypothetical protein